MGTQNSLWHFILAVLCTLMALEGRATTTAAPESPPNVPGSANNSSTTGPATNSSDGSTAELDTPTTQHSLLGTTLLSPSTMRMVGAATTSQPPTALVSSPSSTAGTAGNESEPIVNSPATITASTNPVPPTSGTPSMGSPAVSPILQQSSTSSTTGTLSATTSQPPTAQVFSSPSSTAGTAPFSAGTETQSPATSRPVPSTSPASGAIEARPSPTAGSSTGTPGALLTSTAPTQGQPPVQGMATSPPTGSPWSSTAMASAGSRATTPSGEEEGSTMNQGDRATTETSHSLPATSPVSTMTTVGREGRMDTAPTTIMSETSLGTSPSSGAVSPEFPTTGTGTTTAPESGTASSLSFSSTVMSHSSSSSSSSPGGSPAVPPSPQQSSTSSTTGMLSATTSQPPTAPVFSTAGVTDVGSDTVTEEQVTASPAASTASTNPVAPASESTAPSHSPTPAAPLTPTAPTQGQPPDSSMATSPPTGSPWSSTATASAGSRATAPPGDGESSTMNQGDRTTEPTASTSQSLPATSLATPSMTNLSTSASVNPSVTTTCSPITLSIQLQNVTSRTIQFSWKPQGGTADSPYTVRLLGESGEKEERILNGTSTAFENLLSAQHYQISVNVSTCSKNVGTSLTVQTAAEVYSGTTRITSEDFRDEYQNKSSTEFKEFEEKFIMEITKHLPQKIQELKNGTKIRIVIDSIKAGSVIVVFKIVLDVGQNITKSEISDAFTEALNRSTVFEVDLNETFVEARNSCKPGLNDCDKNAACTAEGATYSCQCNKGFTDTSPQVPGRVCCQDPPSQHTTPVPPKTNTTGFTGTASNSVFTTTFASATCMPVSIEVQKVTGEEIQLSWSSSSSKGSLYNISVEDGKEINTRTTNETESVIKNLIPGHEYNISVALSSCAENNPASVTVRTDSGSCFKRADFCLAQSTGCSDFKGIVCSNNQAFACKVRWENEIFNNTLYNSKSEGYKTMSDRLKADVVETMNAELGNAHSDILVLGFRSGSVIADFLFLLPKEEARDVDDIQRRLSNVLRSKFGSESEVQPLSVQSSTDNSSSWRVAVIVLGVLLGVALVLILLAILFYIHVRRRSGMEFSPLYTW